MSKVFLRDRACSSARVFNVPMPSIFRVCVFCWKCGIPWDPSIPPNTISKYLERKQKNKNKTFVKRSAGAYWTRVFANSGSISQERRVNWTLKEFGFSCWNQPVHYIARRYTDAYLQSAAKMLKPPTHFDFSRFGGVFRQKPRAGPRAQHHLHQSPREKRRRNGMCRYESNAGSSVSRISFKELYHHSDKYDGKGAEIQISVPC